jgi:hypothetical protein
MFIDSDIGFNPNDVLSLLALQDDESPYDIIGGPYPKKCISWEKIVQAVNKGVGDENPNELEKYVGDFVFNPIVDAGQTEIKLNEPAKVLEIGTGFMMIKRKVFDEYKAAYPQYSYKPDHVRTAAFDGTREFGYVRGWNYNTLVLTPLVVRCLLLLLLVLPQQPTLVC